MNDNEIGRVQQGDIDEFYGQLKESGWKVCGRSITCRDDWYALVSARFREFSFLSSPYSVFLFILGNIKADGNELTFKTAYQYMDEFLDCFHYDDRAWHIGNQYFPPRKWEEATVKFFEPDDSDDEGEESKPEPAEKAAKIPQQIIDKFEDDMRKAAEYWALENTAPNSTTE